MVMPKEVAEKCTWGLIAPFARIRKNGGRLGLQQTEGTTMDVPTKCSAPLVTKHSATPVTKHSALPATKTLSTPSHLMSLTDTPNRFD